MKSMTLTLGETEDGRLKVIHGKRPVAVENKDRTIRLIGHAENAPTYVAEWIKTILTLPDGF